MPLPQFHNESFNRSVASRQSLTACLLPATLPSQARLIISYWWNAVEKFIIHSFIHSALVLCNISVPLSRCRRRALHGLLTGPSPTSISTSAPPSAMYQSISNGLIWPVSACYFQPFLLLDAQGFHAGGWKTPQCSGARAISAPGVKHNDTKSRNTAPTHPRHSAIYHCSS